MIDVRAWGRAHAVGAVHEAERLGSAVVGTEHLLMASLADPSVRWAFRTVGVDTREVQDEVVKATGGRPCRARTASITGGAADALMHAGGDCDALDADRPRGADVGRVLRVLAQRFLSRTEHSRARVVLDNLGVIHHRARVLTVIEHNAQRARRPAPEEQSAPHASVESRRSRRLQALSAELHPEAPA